MRFEPVGLSDVVQVTAGYSHSLALTTQGQVVAWGWNDSGECDVVQVAAGVAHLH